MQRNTLNNRLQSAVRRVTRCSLSATCLCSLLVVVLGVACRPDHGNNKSQTGTPRNDINPVLVVGLDGLEWDLLLPMLADEKLPNLADIIQQGTAGQLATLLPTSSPVIWTSIATGMSRSKHGIQGFVHPERDADGWQKLYTTQDRRTKALWNILTDYGLRTCSVGWWITFPAEQINGVMVAQANTSNPEANQTGTGIWKGGLVPGLDGQVFPPERQAEILSVLEEVEASLPELTRTIFGDFDGELSALSKKQWDACQWAFRADATYHRVGLKLLREEPAADLFLIYFGGPDVAGHRFWRYMDPEAFAHKPDPTEVGHFRHAIEAYYAYVDGVLGDLVRAAPKNVNILVISDHGMQPINLENKFLPTDETRDLISGGHHNAEPGFIAACGPDIRRRESLKPFAEWSRRDVEAVGSVFDIAPTILALRSLPVGRDMDGAALTEIIEPSFLEKHPVQLVDSFTPRNWYEDRNKTAATRSDLVERLEQLRALGYIGGPTPIESKTGQDGSLNNQ